MALTCIRQKKPYFGITLTPKHSEVLIARLIHHTWLSLLDESSKLYVPELAKIMEGGLTADTNEKKPKGKATAKGKPKATAKATAKANAGGAGTDDTAIPKDTATGKAAPKKPAAKSGKKAKAKAKARFA